MNEIQLIYFEGCPEAQQVRAALIAAGVSGFKEILQDKLPETDPYRKFSSPSVLAGNELIYGIRADGEKSTCTFDVINFVDQDALTARFQELNNVPWL